MFTCIQTCMHTYIRTYSYTHIQANYFLPTVPTSLDTAPNKAVARRRCLGCVDTYIYMYMCVSPLVFRYVYICIYTQYTYIYIHMYIYIHIFLHTIFLHICTHIYIYVYDFVYVHLDQPMYLSLESYAPDLVVIGVHYRYLGGVGSSLRSGKQHHGPSPTPKIPRTTREFVCSISLDQARSSNCRAFCTPGGGTWGMGGCQNYGPLLGNLNTRCRIVLRTPKGTMTF